MSATVRVAVVGASGYAGGELIRLLAGHPSVRITSVHARDRDGAPVAGELPNLAPLGLSFRDGEPEDVDVAFLALPHGASAPVAARLLDRGVTVVDIGADFRLRDAEAYATWYGAPHPAPELLKQAVYGLTECSRDRLAGATLIANPGCYPTAALLALVPFARWGVIDGDVIVDAKSGISGAGRSAGADYLFTELTESTRAYGLGGHRHRPEIEQGLASAGATPHVTFVPHLVPQSRGIHATCYLSLRDDLDDEGLAKILHDAYDGEPFVHVSDDAAGDEADDRLEPRLRPRAPRRGATRGRRVGDRQPRQGSGRAGGPEHERRPRPGRDRRAHRRGASPMSVTFARGFAVGVGEAGIRESGGPDLVIIASDQAGAAAATFTTNRLRAAPVLVAVEALQASGGSARAIVVNAGCANAGTGPGGLDDARAVVAAAAAHLGCEPDEVLPASTGLIGSRLPVAAMVATIPTLELRRTDGAGTDAARAIMTTDTRPKEHAVTARLDDGREIRIGGMAKGAGMIHPQMATMLAFLTTDAPIASQALAELLRPAVERTFNQVTIDGDTSTNDAVIVLANGAAGGTPIATGAEREAFADALESGLPRACDRHRGRWRGSPAPDRGLRVRRAGRRRGTGGRAHGRLVLARQDRGPRCRPELGPHRRRGGSQRGAARPRSAEGLHRRRARLRRRAARLRRGAGRRAPARPRRAPGARPCGRRRQRRRLGLRPVGRVRRDQQRVHDMSDELLTIKLGGVAGAHAASLSVLAERAVPGWVIVHGGGNEVGDWSRRLGNEPATLDGLRVTDAETLDVAVAVLRGLVNARLVASFAARNVPAIGLGGADGDLLGAERFDPRLGEVGRVVRVNTDLLATLAGSRPRRDRGADRARRRRGAAQRERRRGGRRDRRGARWAAAAADRRAGRAARDGSSWRASRRPRWQRCSRTARRTAAWCRSCGRRSWPRRPAARLPSWMGPIRTRCVRRWMEYRPERP